jgi:hypothetical protein
MLESGFRISLILIAEVRIFMHSNQRTSPQIKVFDHQLPESIVRIVHFIVEYEGQVELFVYVGHQIIDSIGIDIAEHTLTVEKSRGRGIDFMLLYDFLEFTDF